MKLRGFALTLELAVLLMLMTILIGGGISFATISWYKNYQSDILRDKCNQLEYAVRRYGQNHEIVDVSSESYDAEGKLHYNMLQSYPTSQSGLSVLHTLGFLQSGIKISDFQLKSTSNGVKQDNSVVFYRVNSNYTKYRIEVMLPNGSKYVTPGSSSF